MKITIDTAVAAPVEEVCRAWTTPEDVKKWLLGGLMNQP